MSSSNELKNTKLGAEQTDIEDEFKNAIEALRKAAAMLSQPEVRESLAAIQGAAKAVAVIQDAAKAVAIQDAMKAVSIQDAAKAVAVQDAMKAVSIQDAAKAVAIQDAMKAVSIQDAAKAVAIQDAAISFARSQEIIRSLVAEEVACAISLIRESAKAASEKCTKDDAPK